MSSRDRATRVAALVLAAGRGSRYGPDASKVTAQLHGVALVRRVVETALRSQAMQCVVVSGHRHQSVETALRGLDVRLVKNVDYEFGLAKSIKAGMRALADEVDGVLVMLGDMPLVETGTLDSLIRCFGDRDGIDAVVPTFAGTRGNPALIGRSLFDRLESLDGDHGARQMLSAPDLSVVSCEVADRGILIDVDTRADLAALED